MRRGWVMADGIKMKFHIRKADGSPISPEACYFVLRLDGEVSDENFMHASRRAMRVFAENIRDSIPALAEDIDACLDELERPPCGCREASCPHGPWISKVWRYGDETDGE